MALGMDVTKAASSAFAKIDKTVAGMAASTVVELAVWMAES